MRHCLASQHKHIRCNWQSPLITSYRPRVAARQMPVLPPLLWRVSTTRVGLLSPGDAGHCASGDAGRQASESLDTLLDSLISRHILAMQAAVRLEALTHS